MTTRPVSRDRVLLPGMVQGAPRRNALVLIAYLFVAVVATQALWSLL